MGTTLKIIGEISLDDYIVSAQIIRFNLGWLRFCSRIFGALSIIAVAAICACFGGIAGLKFGVIGALRNTALTVCLSKL